MTGQLQTIILLPLTTAYLVYWSSLWIVHLMAIIYGKWRLYRKPSINTEVVLTTDPEKQSQTKEMLEPLGVSIIKPVCGPEDNLIQNLETFFTLDYKKYEILFCIQDLEDSVSYMFIKNMMEKYPEVEVKVFRGGENVGVNPKINNMLPAYRAASYDLILVSDSGIKMKEDTLTDMVTAMKDDIGLVHQMPYTCDGAGLPSTLEKVFFGTFHARIYLSAALVGINCATGMSALMRKELLDKAGGFEAFGCYLAEDFFFAKCITDQNYKLAISSQPAAQNTANRTVSSFHNRISRWIKLRSAMVPHTIILEPLSECMLSGALAAGSAYILFRVDPVCFYLVHILAWFICDWILIHIVQNGALPFNKFEFLVMWMFRECAAPYLFLHAILHPDVRWREQQFRLKWGGKAEPKLNVINKNPSLVSPATIQFSKAEDHSPLP